MPFAAKVSTFHTKVSGDQQLQAALQLQNRAVVADATDHVSSLDLSRKAADTLNELSFWQQGSLNLKHRSPWPKGHGVITRFQGSDYKPSSSGCIYSSIDMSRKSLLTLARHFILPLICKY